MRPPSSELDAPGGAQRGSSAPSQGARGLTAYRLLSLALLASGLVASAAHSGLLPFELARRAGLPLLLCGAAMPWIAWLSPRESSALKLVFFGALLSPALLAGLFALSRTVLAPDAALALSLAFAALGQLVALRARVRFDPPGRAAWAALALALLGAACAGARAGWLSEASGLSLDSQIKTCAAAQMLLREGPLESPWFAATPLADSLLPACWQAAFGGFGHLAPPSVEALVRGWASLVLALGSYLLAAALWREGRRCVLAVLFAGTAFGALGFLPGLDQDARGALGLERLSLASVSALAATLAAWVAGAHALRHGMRPWPLLLASAHALAWLLDPAIGALGLLVTLLALALRPGAAGVRAPVALGLSFAGLPVFALFRILGSERLLATGPAPQAPPVSLAWWLLALSPLALAALAGLVGRSDSRPLSAGAALGESSVVQLGPSSARAAGTLRTLYGLAALIPLALALLVGVVGVDSLARSDSWLDSLGGLSAEACARLAGFPLAVLAAGGVVSLWDQRGPARLVGLALGGLLLVGSLLPEPAHLLERPPAPHLFGGSLETAGRALRLRVETTEPLPDPSSHKVWRPSKARGDGPELAAALDWLRRAAPRTGSPLLWLRPSGRGWLPAGSGLPLAGLLADLPLWAVRPAATEGASEEAAASQVAGELDAKRAAGEPPAGAASPAARPIDSWARRREERATRLAALFEQQKDWDPVVLAELQRVGRPAYALVDESDRIHSHRGDADHARRGIDLRLKQLGAEVVFESGRVCVYALGFPPESDPR